MRVKDLLRRRTGQPRQQVLPLGATEPPRQLVAECDGKDLPHHLADLEGRGYCVVRMEQLGVGGWRVTAQLASLFRPAPERGDA